MAAATLTAEMPENSSLTHFEDAIAFRLQSDVLASFFIINIALGLPSNSYIVWLITTRSKSGVASEFFSLNLTVYEIMVCLSSPPNFLQLLCYNTCMNFYSVYYINLFFFVLLFMGRPLFQCCVCVERYVAVVHPVLFLKYKPLRYRMAFSAAPWLIILGLCIGSMFSLSNKWIYYMLLPHYLVLLSIKSLCSVAVLRALRRPSPGRGVGDVEIIHMKKKAFWMMLVFVVSMVINLCPAVFFICVSGILTNVQKTNGSLIVYCTIILTGFVHPFTFFYRSGKFPFSHCL